MTTKGFSINGATSSTVLDPTTFFQADGKTFTWEFVESVACMLATTIKETGIKYNGVVGVARGGVIPATIVASILGVRNFRSIQFARYNEGKPGKIIMDETAHGQCLPGRWLIVDDIVGTGETMEAIQNHFPMCDFCALFAREPIAHKVLAGGTLCEGTGWITFPWELHRTKDGTFKKIGEII